MILSLNKSEKIIIPKESIRFRVIANSDNDNDQLLKRKIVTNLNKNIESLLTLNNNILSSRENIKQNIPQFNEVIDRTLNENNSKETYKIKYGMNYFPKKEYKGVIYEEGDYESLVVTLGEGKGKNFWCVLFPPLCLLEGEKNKNTKEVEYKSFIKEVIDKYF